MDYEAIHKKMAYESAIKRERELLEGIAPAIEFLERKLADTTEALEALKRVRANALAEITGIEARGIPVDDESALAAVGIKMELFEGDEVCG